MKRFWSEATIVPEAGGFGVRLDGRPVRTPAKAPCVLPNRALGAAVAAEWAAQGNVVDPVSMPLTRAANSAIDRVIPQHEAVALAIAFDLPTQTGCDADHPLARGEVGKVGVPIGSLDDVVALFDGLPLDRMNTSMTINATAPWLLALYVATAERTGVDPKLLRGTTQNDIIKEYLSRGTYVFPPDASRSGLISDMVAYSVDALPKWNPINVCSYHLQEAGATPVQEIAYAMATRSPYSTR